MSSSILAIIAIVITFWAIFIFVGLAQSIAEKIKIRNFFASEEVKK